jgi:hypothetical protein
MKETDLQNLEAVFAYARQTVVNNEAELINLINYKKDLLERIKSLIKEEQSLKENT